ncbi:MAG TPA: pentapeptide repeat-containing protein [Pyrinomonadaceae bacterium]
MANSEHLEALSLGVKSWNAWRKAHSRAPRKIVPDLSGAKLNGFNLRGYDLSHANLWEVDFRQADLRRADLSFAQMSNADLRGANLSRCQIRFAILSGADLTKATLRYADLRGTSLRRASLNGADLRSTILRHASLVGADVQDANLSGAEVYGAGIWGLKGEPAAQTGLIIQPTFETPPITIDDLDTAQFLFVMLDNLKIADVIDAASSRTVLILGRFTPARKRVLEAIKTRLLERNFVPVLFDFQKPRARDLTETIASLAHMACFIIADLTDAKSIPQELSYIVPYLPSVPIVPLIGKNERPYAMFEHFTRYSWVHPAVKYSSLKELLSIFDDRVLKVGYCEAMRSRGIRKNSLPKVTNKCIVNPKAVRKLKPSR